MPFSVEILVACAKATTITETEVVTNLGHTIKLEHPAFDATGFDMRQSLAGGLFEFDNSGCTAAPMLTGNDESTVCPNVFLAGPNVKHGKAIFCFIYKYVI